MTTPRFTAQFMDSGFYAGRAAFGSSPLHISLDLDHPFTTSELERGVVETIEAFPVLGCRYELGLWRDTWSASDDDSSLPLQELDSDEDLDTATAKLMVDELDPCRDGPWRVTQIRARDGCRLIVTVLHMLADAAGALTVVRELGARLTGVEPHQSWGDRGMDRSLFQIIRALRISDVGTLLAETASFLALPFRYLRFARHKELGAAGTEMDLGNPVFRSVRFDVAPGSAIRRRCRKLGCTVNDALVAVVSLLNDKISGAGDLGAFFTVDFRRFLEDALPRVTNASGMEVLMLSRSDVGDFDRTAKVVHEKISKRKRRLPGLPAIIANFAVMTMLPHALLRFVIPLWARWGAALVNRGLLVTNIGSLDSYLDTFGERVTDATMFGPFLPGFDMPVITATGFKNSLVINVNGFDGSGLTALDLLEGQLQNIMESVSSAE